MDNNSEEEIKIEARKRKIKDFFKNKSRLLLISIFIIIFFIRLYYFILTMNQPIWWDESDYMATAKNFAGIGNYKLESIRLPTLSLLVSVFFKLGFSEPYMRFFVLFIPSLILIFLVYYLIKLMYDDKRIALVSVVIFSVLWEHLFYSNRFHTENFALIFEFLALIVLVKTYIKKERFIYINHKYSLIFITFLSIIAVMFRPGNIIFIPGIFFFLILLKGNVFFKNKKNIIYSVLALVILFSLFLFTLEKVKIPIISSYYAPERDVAWVHLTVFKGFFQPINANFPNLFYYFFILGILIFIFNFCLKIDKLKTFNNDEKDLEFKFDLLNLLIIISVLISFIFFLRPSSYEYRWFFPLLPGLLVFPAKSLISVSNFIGEKIKNKKIIIFLIVLLVFFGLYTQLTKADAIIKSKVESYLPVKQSGIWIKENSNFQDSIVSASVPQHSYYSERKVYNFAFESSDNSEDLFNEKIKEIKPKYVVVSMFEPGFTPEWVYEWPNKNQDKVVPVKVYFADSEMKQPILVVYEFKY